MIARVVLAVLRIVARNRELRRVELAFMMFNISELATWLAMLIYAYAHGGVTEAGILATVMLVPAAIFAPIFASAGERHPPGHTLLAGYGAQAVTCAAVGVAMLAHADKAIVYVLLVGPAIAYATTRPVQAAFAPGLARRPEELAATNVVSSWIESVSMLAGPLLVGVLLTVGSPGTVFAFGAVCCAVGGLLVSPVRDAVAATASAEAQDDDPSGLGSSLHFLRQDANARILVLLFGAQCAAIGALDVLYVELASGVLHKGGNWAGYLNAAFGAGGVIAVLVTARLVGRTRLALPLVVALAGWTAALFGLAGTTAAAGAVVLLAAAGVARATFDVTGRTLLQRVARPDLLARVFGLLEGLEMVGLAVGTLLAPLLVALGGASAAFVGVALILPLVALSAGRRLLDIDRHATVPVVEIALLRSLPMFSLLPPQTLEMLARAVVSEPIPPNVDVITQGDEGDRFYVIADGEVDVIADGVHVTTLGRGDAFGEIALLYGVPRTATVRTRGEVHLCSLDRDTFLVALTGHLSSHTAMQGLADERLEELRVLRESRATVDSST